jgi:2'-hydroxyisoflavone reductase
MKILVLGGTSFVGRHFVELAVSEGHEMTLFHRGKTGSDLFPNCEHILGDRSTDLDNLAGRKWDAVVDTSGYLPGVVRASAAFLKDKVERYLFISTLSVYEGWDGAKRDESGNLQTIESEDADVGPETYGPFKVLCEQAVEAVYGERSTILRPGLIFGPYDPTNRFPYWVERFATQEKVLVPDRLDQPTQQVDARDLGLFILKCLNDDLAGTYNVCGPDDPRTLGDLFADCEWLQAGTQSVLASQDFLKAEDVEPGRDLPLVMPFDGSHDTLMQVDAGKAINAGLTFRHWSETTLDTWHWIQAEGLSAGRSPGPLSKEREAELIAKIESIDSE